MNGWRVREREREFFARCVVRLEGFKSMSIISILCLGEIDDSMMKGVAMALKSREIFQELCQTLEKD